MKQAFFIVFGGILFTFLFIGLIISAASCTNNADEPKYAYHYGIDKEVPDSLKVAQREWITKTVAACNNRLTGGDIEDQEKVIEQAESSSERLFGVEVEGLYMYDAESEYNPKQVYYYTFIPKRNLNPLQLKLFNELKSPKKLD